MLVLLIDRVTGNDLDDTKPKARPSDIPNTDYIPSEGEQELLKFELSHIVAQCAVKYMKGFQPVKGCVPKIYPHGHMEVMKQKSEQVYSYKYILT